MAPAEKAGFFMTKEAIPLLANDVLAKKAGSYARELLYWEGVIMLKEDVARQLQGRQGFEGVEIGQITAVDFLWLDVDDQRQSTEGLREIEKFPVLLVSNDGEKIKNRREKLGAKIVPSFITKKSSLAITGNAYGGYVSGVEMERDMFGDLVFQDLISKRPLILTDKQNEKRSLSNCLVIVGRELVGQRGVLAISVKLSNSILGEVFDENGQLRDEGGVKEFRRLEQEKQGELERLEREMLDLTTIEPEVDPLKVSNMKLFNYCFKKVGSLREDGVGVLKGGVGVEGLGLTIKKEIGFCYRDKDGLMIEGGKLEMTLGPVILPPEIRQIEPRFLLAGTGEISQKDKEGGLKITMELFKEGGMEIKAWFEDRNGMKLKTNADFFAKPEIVARLMTVVSSEVIRRSGVVFEAETSPKRTPDKLRKPKPLKKDRRKRTNRR